MTQAIRGIFVFSLSFPILSFWHSRVKEIRTSCREAIKFLLKIASPATWYWHLLKMHLIPEMVYISDVKKFSRASSMAKWHRSINQNLFTYLLYHVTCWFFYFRKYQGCTVWCKNSIVHEMINNDSAFTS